MTNCTTNHYITVDSTDRGNRGELNTGFDPNPKRASLHSMPIAIDQLLSHVTNLANAPGGFKQEFIVSDYSNSLITSVAAWLLRQIQCRIQFYIKVVTRTYLFES
jgi:hypothetical protein